MMNVSAHNLQLENSSGFSFISSTKPIRRASFASILFAVKSISSALASPIKRGKRCVPPQPVMIPRLTPGCEKTAFGEATRLSHAKAKSRAPPKQNPLTAAIVVCRANAILFIKLCPRKANSRAVSFVTAAISRKSAPEAKTSATPVKMIVRSAVINDFV
jgi:hypothetical protein